MEEGHEMSYLLFAGKGQRARVLRNRDVHFIDTFGFAKLQQGVGAARGFEDGLRLPDPEAVDEVGSVSGGCAKVQRPT
jgi:hypothetical protein